MLGPGSCLLLAAFSSAVVEAAIGADGEVAAGRAPLEYTGPSEDSVTFTLVPGASLRWRTPEDTFALSYTPRIFYRLPNSLNFDRPLVLHQAGLDHSTDLSHRVSWASSAQLSVGQIDYTAAGVVFDPTLSSAVRTSITDILRGVGETGFKFALTRRANLDLEASAEYTTTLDDVDVIALPPSQVGEDAGGGQTIFGSVIPSSFQLRTRPSLSYSISRAANIAGAVDVTYQWFQQTARYLLISPDISWDTQLSKRTTLGLAGGLAYVWTLDAAETAEQQENSIGGTGSVDFSSILYRAGRTSLTTGLNASLEWFFDPIAGTSQPRAGATLSNALEVGREWLFSPSVAFYTVLRERAPRLVLLPDADGATTPEDLAQNTALLVTPDATLLRIELPVRYQVSKELSLSFGGRAALRGRALADPGFRLNEQVELWAFLGLTVRFATGQGDSSWLPL